MSVLNEHDWEDLTRQFRSAKPFPSICVDNFLKEDFANSLAASYPKYSEAKEVGQEWTSLNEKLKVQITDPSLFPTEVTDLCETLGSQQFIDTLSNMSDIAELRWDPKFRGGGIHMTGPSGILDVHVDFNYDKILSLYRRLNILIYLNPTWDESWGGKVELWDKDVANCGQSFAPIHNRCVIFATTDYSFHGVTAVACPEGMTRNSLAAYYYSEEAGDNSGEDWGGNHTTIFRARPYELKKKYFSMPIQRLKASMRTLAQQRKNRP